MVVAAPTLSFDGDLPAGEVGKSYSTDLSATGGTAPYTFSVSAGDLPGGLQLDRTSGALTGTPSTGGRFEFTVRVTDALGGTDTKAAVVTVRGPVVLNLTASASSIRFGSQVTSTARLDPSATGTVVFYAGEVAEGNYLGEDTVSNGVATLVQTPERFGPYTVIAVYQGDATHLGATSTTTSTDVNGYVGQAVITEFRTSGPGGADDSYVELYNPGQPLPLAGLVVESGSGTRTVLPADAPVLQKNRTYLVVGRGFSLGGFASADLTANSLGTGGLRLVIPDAGSTVADAAGPVSSFHLGTALPTLTGSPSEQYAFVRVEKAGRPVNTGQNASDFALVSATGGKVGGVQSMRGSASPTGLGDDWQHDEQVQSFLLDQSVSVDAVPNRPYVVGKPGTLEIRRTITNTGTTTISSAKARVTSLSEANGLPYYGANPPATPAAIRAVNPKTATSNASVRGRGTVTVQNLKVDAPITATAGGGLNSTFTIPLPSGGLAPGASVDVAFTFEVDVRGTFWFGYDIDAREAGPSPLRTSKAQTKVSSKVSSKTVDKRLAASGKTRSQAVAPQTRGTL